MKPKSPKGRRVNKNVYETQYQAAHEKAKTAHYQEVRRRHPAVERKLNEIVRHQGGRQCLFFTRAKVRAQQLMTCFAVNLKRISLLIVEGSLLTVNEKPVDDAENYGSKTNSPTLLRPAIASPA